MPDELPIFRYKNDLINSINEYQCLLLIGGLYSAYSIVNGTETGSGKTTQLCQYIYESNSALRIAITQPRRIAATSAAKRVAFEMSSEIGMNVGYTIRFEKQTSSATKINFMTDGILLRECMQSPTLNTYDIVILDEAHERSIETDILLGLLKRAVKTRDDLKIVIMSATLNVEKFVEFFEYCPVFSVPGKIFDVEVKWSNQLDLEVAKSSFCERAIDTVLYIHQHEDDGDVLVFLTGQFEIENACKALQQKFDEISPKKSEKLLIYPIYASLDSLDQKAIFDKTPKGHRKVIFATNIAQTSITIPEIRFVVDSGFVKQKMYDSKSGMDALLTVPISQAAATQRAGRAGRTATGKVYRLYSQQAFFAMELDTVPEIQRSSLISTVLSLKKMGIVDIAGFDIPDPPDPNLIFIAERQLFLLGALTESGELTSLGDKMSRFPISPFLSKVLISSHEQFSCHKQVAKIIAMLSVEEPFTQPRSKSKQQAAANAHATFYHPTGDHLTLYNIFNDYADALDKRKFCSTYFIRMQSLRMATDVYNQLLDMLDYQPDVKKRRSTSIQNDILQSFCSAYYIQAAKKGGRQWYPYSATKLDNVRNSPMGLAPGSALMKMDLDLLEWVIYHQIQWVGRPMMRLVSVIQYEWIETFIEKHTLAAEKAEFVGVESVINVIPGETMLLSAISCNAIDHPVPQVSSSPNLDEERRIQRESKAKEAKERYLKRKK